MKTQTKAKKAIIYIALLIVGIVLGWLFFGTGSENEIHSHSEQQIETVENTIWTCSMHPQIRQEEKGDCPICGMDLIPVEEENEIVNTSGEITMNEQAVKLANIQTSTVEFIAPSKEIILQGKIKPDEREVVNQAIHFSGRVEKLMIKYEGEYVKKGEILATIYSPELITAQEELLEALKFEKSNPVLAEAVKRKLKYWKLTGGTIDNIIKAGQVSEFIDIFSESSGYVLHKFVTEGDYVKRGDVLFEITNLDKLWVIFDAYEEDLPFINPGDKISFEVKSLPGLEFEAKVSFIDPVVDMKKRVIRIRAEINNSGDMLKPDMFVTGLLIPGISPERKVLAVPLSAIMWTGKRSVVYVSKNKNDQAVFEFREVVLGDNLGDYYVINSGLEHGEQVVTNGTFSVDAAAQLQNKKSMMNREGEKRPAPGHHHGDISDENHSDEQYKTDKLPSINETFLNQYLEILEIYLSVKNALVASDAETANDEAKLFIHKLEQLDMSMLDHKNHMIWIELLTEIKNNGNEIASSKELEIQRKYFKSLSTAMITAAKIYAIKNGPYYVQYCPMADDNKGGYWLSKNKIIENPYYGDMMLRCGEVKEVIDNNN